MSRTWALRIVFVCCFLAFALLVLRRRIIENIEGHEVLIALFYDGWAFVLIAALGLYALYRLIVTRAT